MVLLFWIQQATTLSIQFLLSAFLSFFLCRSPYFSAAMREEITSFLPPTEPISSCYYLSPRQRYERQREIENKRQQEVEPTEYKRTGRLAFFSPCLEQEVSDGM